MKNYRITVLKGDGIGPEIVDEAMKVLNATGEKFGFSVEYDFQLMGGRAIDATGVPLPQATVDSCKKSDSVLLGAVGGAKWDTLPGHLRPEAGLLGIRAALGLYANLRPARIFEALKAASPIKASIIGDNLDIMVIRELTGGIYFGERGRYEKNGVQAAFDTEMYTVPEIKRIAKVGFEMAKIRSGRLCSVDKANVLESSRLWRETVIEMAADYPEVELSHMYVDNCAMQLINRPTQFDVIVTSNLFGDILSDEASMLSGSIGMLASASLAEGSFGLYEPIHGSAPDIAGKGVANPLATILSVAMMLKYSFNLPEAAAMIEKAVDEAMKTMRTPDIYEEGLKKVGTVEMGDMVVQLVKTQ
ncbi:MAG: 3-isopropylmalate dehydrogenase [Eubacteriales bacterium]